MFLLNFGKVLKFIALITVSFVLLSSTLPPRGGWVNNFGEGNLGGHRGGVAVAVAGAEEDDNGIIIGIDLGTTYSAAGMMDPNGNMIIFPNEQGNRITPSVVSFDGHQRLIGDAAKNALGTNPTNTVFDSKRMIGRKFLDKPVQQSLKLWPFKVSPNKANGAPNIEVQYKGETRVFAPEEISAMILRKMKEIAENYLGKEVKKAVITVPAYFDDTQKAATRDAGRIAGLEVARIIAEPTAAAVAYGIDKKHSEANVIIYDLGGGTFDVSLLNLDEGVFEVLATSGDTHLGGEDFDEKVMNYFIKKFDKKFYKEENRDVSSIKNRKSLKDHVRGVAKLRREVEKAKRALSVATQIKIEVDNIDGVNDFSEVLTRARFEEINHDLFMKTLKPLQQVLKDAKLQKKDIEEVILVGGSTRIPKIQELVSKFFNGKKLNRGINPDEAVAHGAAIQAAILSPNIDLPNIDKTLILDAIPISLGIETVGGVMTTLISKNTVFPTSKTQVFSTYQDNQPAVGIKVYQGERAMTKNNRFLGDFTLNDIPPASRGVPQIEVTFAIDSNGILNVKAQDKATTSENSITITADKQTLTKDEVDEMLRTAEAFKDDDDIMKKTVAAKNQLESSAYRLRNSISSSDDDDSNNIGQQLDEEDLETLNEIVEEIISWIDDNPMADLDGYEEKQKEFDETIQPIMAKVYGSNSGGGGPGGSGSSDGNTDSYYDHEDL